MEQPRDLLAELIADAELVTAYGQRSGRLRDVSLIAAIAAVKGLATPQWSDPEVIRLQIALNRTVQDIAPVLVSDLHDTTWRPFDPPLPWYRQPQSLVFVLISLVALVLTATSTIGYNKGILLNDEISAYFAKTDQIYISKVTSTLIDPRSTDAEYSSAVQVLRDVSESFASYSGRANTYLAQFKEPIANLVDLFRGGAAMPQGGGSEDLCKDKEVSAARLQLRPVRQASVIVQSGSTAQSLFLQQIAALCNENIPTALLFSATNGFVYQIRDRLDPWRAFYLPALYGAFGATVYYMRRILEPSVRNPPFIRFAMRVVMGAFAGVIITWFSVPSAQLLNNSGLTVFTLAFLAGFAVEVLFVVLDRLVATVASVARGSAAHAEVVASAPAPAKRRTSAKSEAADKSS